MIRSADDHYDHILSDLHEFTNRFMGITFRCLIPSIANRHDEVFVNEDQVFNIIQAIMDRNGIPSSIGDTLQASYIFGPLPDGLIHFSLVLPRLPSLPADFAPEGWSVPIQLVTAQVTPGGSSIGLPVASGYVPANNLATAKGVSFELAQVGQAEQETGLQVHYRWDKPDWTQLNNVGLSLRDGEGHSYAQLHAPMEPSGAPASLRTYRFEPFLSGVSQGILSVDQLHFTFKSQAYFDFDPREDMLI